MNEEELRKKEQELQGKETEIEELKRGKENAQQQAQENKTLTARNEELEKEVERLNAERKKQKKESEKLKEENEEELRKKEQEIQEKVKEIEELKRKEKEVKSLNVKIKELEEELKEIKGNKHYLLLAAMCDQLQKNFHKIVFYPHNFSNKQSYKEKDIEYNINKGRYGLTTEEDKDQARERWSALNNDLGWESERHVMGIVELKRNRNLAAHPEITKDMKESLVDGAKALNHERKLNEPTFGIVQNLTEMWLKTEDLVQEQEKKKNKEQTA